MKKIDLNVDLGEGFGFDRELLAVCTSANVCCGEHAGSEELTRETVALCREMGVRVGAHPGYPDRTFMGRRSCKELLVLKAQDLEESLIEQVGRIEGAAYLKPHGAFYNDSARGDGMGETLWRILEATRWPLMGLAESKHETIARSAGVKMILEGFADRAYTDDGFLVPRSEPGAVLSSVGEKAKQAVWLAERVDSICVHGDEEDSVATVTAVRVALEKAGYEVGF